MLVHHKCTVTIEENAILQCFAATQAASAIWLANSISTCIHIIIQKSWRANCLRSRTALQKRVFLNRHCTFVVHQHGGSYRLLQTVYTKTYMYSWSRLGLRSDHKPACPEEADAVAAQARLSMEAWVIPVGGYICSSAFQYGIHNTRQRSRDWVQSRWLDHKPDLLLKAIDTTH